MPCGVRTLGSCETAGPAKGCFLRFPLVFQKHKNRHGMPRRAALEPVYREKPLKAQHLRQQTEKMQRAARFSSAHRENRDA
jgi:hypothetical protein